MGTVLCEHRRGFIGFSLASRGDSSGVSFRPSIWRTIGCSEKRLCRQLVRTPRERETYSSYHQDKTLSHSVCPSRRPRVPYSFRSSSCPSLHQVHSPALASECFWHSTHWTSAVDDLATRTSEVGRRQCRIIQLIDPQFGSPVSGSEQEKWGITDISESKKERSHMYRMIATKLS